MAKYFEKISIKNKITFSLLLVFLVSLGIGIIEYNRIIKIGQTISIAETLNKYTNGLKNIENSYYKLQVLISEIANASDNENFIKNKNKLKSLQQDLDNSFKKIEQIDISKINKKDFLKTFAGFNDSIFNYKSIYETKVVGAINNFLHYKYLILHPVQIKENYRTLLSEQQKLGYVSKNVSELNMSRDRIVKQLEDTYLKSIETLKTFIFNSLKSQEFSIDKLTYDLSKYNTGAEKTIHESRNKVIILSAVLFLIAIVIILLIGLILANSVSKPLLEINEVLRGISRGSISRTFEIDRTDELGIILGSVNELIIHLNKTVKFSKEISQGNFDYEYTPSGDEDMLGNSLLQLRESLITAKKEEEKRKLEDIRRNRATDGIAIFSEILRQNQKDIKKLGREIISNLIKFLKANQGVIFIVEEENGKKYLNLIAAYAWNREKYLEKKIEIGDGLIGAVAEEKFTVYMTDVPEDYIEIKSGTGGANPRSILLVPLKIDEDILGVIEIASFNEFEQYEIEIVERIAENIASTLKSVKISEQTTELLEKFQIQAEEMKYQEESLKNTIQELQKSHDEVKLREEELSTKLKEINELNKQIQFKDEQLKKEIERITEENKEKLKTIEKQNNNLRSILDKMILGVVIVKEGGSIVYTNESTEKMLGYTDIEMLGLDIEKLIELPIEAEGKKLCEYLFENIEEITKEGGREFVVRKKNGEVKKVLIDLMTFGESENMRLVILMQDLEYYEKKHLDTNTFVNELFEEELENRLKIQYYEDILKKNNIDISEFVFDKDEIIKWGPKYQLGISLIDNQHKKWIEFINKFFASLLHKKDEAEVRDLLNKLKDYTDYHFGFEEKYMDEFSYEDIEKHKQKHKEFTDSLDSILTSYSQGKETSIHRLVMYLMDWVTDHVLVTDRKYVELFKKNGLR